MSAGAAAAQPADGSQPAPPPADTAPPADKPPVDKPPADSPPAPVTPPPAPVVVPTEAKPSDAGEQPSKAKAADKAKPVLETKPGGYVQFDGRRLLNGTETHEMTIRRLRFKLDGTATKHFKFRTLIDFAGSKVVVNDAWIEGVILPELSIRAGKDKSQFGLERLQSATQLTFIERAYPTQLAPNRDIGVWLRGDIEKGLVHYAAGIVDGVANNAVIEGETDNHLELNFHLLISPFAGRKGLGDLAIGGATTFGRTAGTLANTGLTNVRSAAQSTIEKLPTSTTDIAATAVAEGFRSRWTAHGYYFRGPAGVLAEYVRDNEPIRLAGSHHLVTNTAWQVAASVALTPGDTPTYKSLKPKHPLDPAKGTWGAVEVAARYSRLSLDAGAFDAGILNPSTSFQHAGETTIGANWYFNEYLKLQVDYSLTTFDSNSAATKPPSEHLIATRFQAAI